MRSNLLALPVPNPQPAAPAGVGTKINTMLGFGLYVVIAACVAGVLICAGRAAVAYRRGELSEVAGGLVAVAFACVLAGSASAVVAFFMN